MFIKVEQQKSYQEIGNFLCTKKHPMIPANNFSIARSNKCWGFKFGSFKFGWFGSCNLLRLFFIIFFFLSLEV